MTPVSLDRLEGAIVKPGIERYLRPLTYYKGHWRTTASLGRTHRLFNYLIMSMEQDCSFNELSNKLFSNPDFSHLCGPEKRVAQTTLYSLLFRLEDRPNVTNNIPHLLEYVQGLDARWRIKLRRLSEAELRNRVTTTSGKGKDINRGAAYPFMIHDGGRPEHDLLKKVNAAVPRNMDDDRRADLCQDLIVGILSGDFREDDLGLPIKELTRRVMQMFPTKYGPLSLDAPITGTDGLTILDTLSDEENPWEMMGTM